MIRYRPAVLRIVASGKKTDGMKKGMYRKGMQELLKRQNEYFIAGRTLDIDYRIAQLKRLLQALHQNEEKLLAALQADLGKAPFEGYETELGFLYEEIRYILRYLRRWTRPKRVRISWLHFPSKGYIYAEPLGSVLIISPWNYPLQLTIAPLAAAIAAGNCAVLKLPEEAVHLSALLAEIIRDFFPPEYIAACTGGPEVGEALLQQPFAHIFFTGGQRVGRIVMEAAAKHLTPVTLELGGKSPCIVDATADIPLATRRIAWGKLLNAGQTCVAPDYLLVHASVAEQFAGCYQQAVKEMYGENPLKNPEYPRIIHARHFDRLCRLMQEGNLLLGGESDPQTCRIAPALLDGVTWESAVMKEEIFGPILPILTYQDEEEIFAAVRHCPDPLALYLFTRNSWLERRVVREIPFGGGASNDTIIHLAASNLPFGGRGTSGMGQYHGKYGFDTFSHQKGILKKSLRMDIALRYPPYNNKLEQLKKLMK